ncbi:MAG: LytR/AlgR family response regulator transcription factor [Schwartzia sp. (in: firmicutes)]
MQIAICEDSSMDMQHLRRMIADYEKQQGEAVSSPDCFSTGKAFLAAFEPGKYQLIFLDNYIGTEMGIDVARAIREHDTKTAIVFVTMSPDFAVEGFSLHALHYLMKPVSNADIEEVFHRLRPLPSPKRPVLSVISNRIPTEVPIDSIRYIEVYTKVCTIYCTQQELKVYTGIEKLLEKLPEKSFLRPHRSYAVNMDFIQNLDADGVHLRTGELLPLRKNGRTEVRHQYMDYLLSQDEE